MTRIEHTPSHIHIQLHPPQWVLSSAVLNGGLVRARHIVNLKVEQNFEGKHKVFHPPEITISDYCKQMGISPGPVVGMMTAASMDSFREVRRVEQGVEVAALMTAGVSNARRAADPAECRIISETSTDVGTINIIVLTNARLTFAAMVEAIITVTEAKSAALQDLGVVSRSTGRQATGTGTDAIAIVSGWDPPEIRYCGKHLIFGEMLASAVMQAISSSVIGANV